MSQNRPEITQLWMHLRTIDGASKVGEFAIIATDFHLHEMVRLAQYTSVDLADMNAPRDLSESVLFSELRAVNGSPRPSLRELEKNIVAALDKHSSGLVSLCGGSDVHQTLELVTQLMPDLRKRLRDQPLDILSVGRFMTDLRLGYGFSDDTEGVRAENVVEDYVQRARQILRAQSSPLPQVDNEGSTLTGIALVEAAFRSTPADAKRFQADLEALLPDGSDEDALTGLLRTTLWAFDRLATLTDEPVAAVISRARLQAIGSPSF
ncbi:hypothetical protein [Lysinibacter cavernae]|uniref:hypothetical protein n=1 Tax=Lysinibacter cavernae TaxID=1640652 RepID=UPI00361984B4